MKLALSVRLQEYAAQRYRTPAPNLPVLSLDDYSGIPFLRDVSGIEAYQHRARIRAREGDLFATVTPAASGYEEYCETRLGLGRVELVEAEAIEGPLEVSLACAQGSAFDRIASRARAAGGMVIHPYMGIEAVWNLARCLAERSGVALQVLAPPPPVTWIANDKRLLSDLARDAVGERIVGPMHARTSIEGLAVALLELARLHTRVALKRTRCASAMGNRVYRSSDLLSRTEGEVSELVTAFWRDKECQEGETVLAVAWEDAVSSPSTQMWIPPEGVGLPVLDGIYEQLLSGEEKVFLGSRPSTLPEAVERALYSASYLLCIALQRLGYVGRCSCDFILVGDPNGLFDIRVTDCNGRWGGTSTPMHLLDRARSGPRGMYLAQDFVHSSLVGVPFSEILKRAGHQAYDRYTGEGRYLFYNVGCLRTAGKLDVVILGQTADEVARLSEEELPALLGV